MCTRGRVSKQVNMRLWSSNDCNISSHRATAAWRHKDFQETGPSEVHLLKHGSGCWRHAYRAILTESLSKHTERASSRTFPTGFNHENVHLHMLNKQKHGHLKWLGATKLNILLKDFNLLYLTTPEKISYSVRQKPTEFNYI